MAERLSRISHPGAGSTTRLMKDGINVPGWVAGERRLWDLMMNDQVELPPGRTPPRPPSKAHKRTGPKRAGSAGERGKWFQELERRRKVRFAVNWMVYNEWIRH